MSHLVHLIQWVFKKTDEMSKNEIWGGAKGHKNTLGGVKAVKKVQTIFQTFFPIFSQMIS